MTDNDLITIKNILEQIQNIINKEIVDRRSGPKTQLYSVTKLEDEKQLSQENPHDSYIFTYLNVQISIYKNKRDNTYSVLCQNWQPNKRSEKGYTFYKNRTSYGSKHYLKEAIELFEMLVMEFIKEKQSVEEKLF